MPLFAAARLAETRIRPPRGNLIRIIEEELWTGMSNDACGCIHSLVIHKPRTLTRIEWSGSGSGHTDRCLMSEVLAEKSDAGNQFAIKSISPACCSFGFRFSMGLPLQ